MRGPSPTLNSPAEGTSAGKKSPHHVAVKTSMDCIQVRRRAAGIPGLFISDLCTDLPLTDSLTLGSSATRAAAQNHRGMWEERKLPGKSWRIRTVPSWDRSSTGRHHCAFVESFPHPAGKLGWAPVTALRSS